MHEMTTVSMGPRSAEIDTQLAPLIEALWRLGIETSFSCEGRTARGPDLPEREEPWGYILFPDVEDLRRFLELFSHTELSTRRFGSDPGNRRPTSPTWERAVHIKRSGPDDSVDESDGIRLVGLVRFPASDIEAMTHVALGACERARRHTASVIASDSPK